MFAVPETHHPSVIHQDVLLCSKIISWRGWNSAHAQYIHAHGELQSQVPKVKELLYLMLLHKCFCCNQEFIIAI